ncbi:tetratricopeptide repeat protein [Croceitalea rosinachiae]|uniref:Tetratricopeptide repeat protein n=1 Tax=Croceitalea rosinachiae TaxID=3075596 RepID=A0ABU3AAJ1_9FLAO|nr:tetratricopeptide repeat protein [Croceitalea sp. F388]MDT0606088.1 tetratricopeptide repeat protein [Croceitalea sp. F388]
MKKLCFLILIFISVTNCKKQVDSPRKNTLVIDTLQGKSLLGKALLSKQLVAKDSAKINNYLNAEIEYQLDSTNAEKLIWVGRRRAYLGDFQNAISVFSEGIKKFPKDARFYRHRGHRYISTRQLDKAITDFENAVELIDGTEDQIEPDGIPNRLNKPVSSLHTNIYYHLGLAYYLEANWEKALENFQQCYNASTNDDMRVAASHWLYMILRRMENLEEANEVLEPITKEMDIIENDGYHQLLLFYKGLVAEDSLVGNGSAGASEAVRYGIAHWHHYTGDDEKAKALYEALLSEGNWAGFGYLAAEAELSRL